MQASCRIWQTLNPSEPILISPYLNSSAYQVRSERQVGPKDCNASLLVVSYSCVAVINNLDQYPAGPRTFLAFLHKYASFILMSFVHILLTIPVPSLQGKDHGYRLLLYVSQPLELISHQFCPALQVSCVMIFVQQRHNSAKLGTNRE